MAEEYKNVPEHESPKIATEESSAATGEVKSRGLFDFLGKKEEVKPQETPLETELEHKTQISEPTFVAKHEEEEHKEHKPTLIEQFNQEPEFKHRTQISEPAFEAKHEEKKQEEHKPTLIEQLHQKHEEEEENKPNLLEKLHRSNSSSSSSSEEEGEDGEKRKKKKENKKIVEGGERTEEEKQGIMDKIKEKLPGHGNKPEDGAQVVVGEPVTIPPASDYPIEHPVEHPVEHSVEHPAEKKGILEKIKEKLPGHHAKSSGEEEKKEKESK